MNIAILKEKVVVNTALFADLNTAQAFLSIGAWPDATAIIELPDGYGIGDFYDGANWVKAPQTEPEPIEPIEPVPTTTERIAALESENNTLNAKVRAQTESITILEDCIVEMAGIVYA